MKEVGLFGLHFPSNMSIKTVSTKFQMFHLLKCEIQLISPSLALRAISDLRISSGTISRQLYRALKTADE